MIYRSPNIPQVFNFDPVSEEEIKNIISSLSNKSSSPDGISNIVLKEIKEVVSSILVTLCNKSFEEGNFPSHCKVTKVIPLFKSGDTDPDNYRSIFVLSAPSRVYEKNW